MSKIMAPAGGTEQLIAAVRCGADSVYFGGQHFNARRNAANFDESAIYDAVSYCHARGVKTYVTVNIIIMDDEIELLQDEADLLAKTGVDGVIIQDMAALELFARRYPSIERLASTQTAVHNLNGVLKLRDMGFDSVVLARELSLNEMEKIVSKAGVKTEAFVHGAHCMSLSGACYMSSILGGRSGNRGLCAQPCRLDWRCGNREYALSLKDMCLFPHIRKMADIGIDLFKIEGRMKRPEYVASAVTACKNALEGREYDTETLESVFSRSGFTDGYIKGIQDEKMFGYRTKDDVIKADSVLRPLEALYRNETPLVPVDMKFKLNKNKSTLEICDGVHTVTAHGPVPRIAENRPLDEVLAAKNLTKTGGTPFYVNTLTSDIEHGLMLPISSLNSMRRDGLDAIYSLRSAIVPHESTGFSPIDLPPHAHSSSSVFWGRFDSAKQVACESSFERIILPLRSTTATDISRFGSKLTVQLPAIIFPNDEEAAEARLRELKANGLVSVWADNIYGLELGQSMGFEVYGGFGLNVTNSHSLDMYARQGVKALCLSFELAMKKAKHIKGACPIGIFAYGNLPLMYYRNCPIKASSGCAVCGGSGSLTDRRGIAFPIECNEKRFSVLHNSLPLHIGDEDFSAFDFALMYFTRETHDDIMRVVSDYNHNRKSQLPRTGGLYYRELL